MTALADRLAEAIERADLAGVAAVLAPLDEAQRAVLAPLAADAFWRYLKMVTAPTTGPRDASDTSHACTTAATVAWLGTGDYPDFPPHRETGSPDWYTQSLFTHAFDTEELHRVLVDRRPHWLPALADRYLASCYWDQVHALIMADVLARPTSPAYLRGLALYAGRRRDLAAIVDEDPGLLAVDLPALFDLPNGLLLIVRNHQWRGDRWRSVLTAQLPVGHALRDRILDGVLDLLATDRPAGEAAELHQFLDALAPTPDELAARRRVLFTLVAHRQPGVVSYAVRRLKRLARAGLVPLAELVDAVEPALLAPAKSTAVAAVGLVSTAARRYPGLAGTALDRYLTAAGHPHPEVQLAAIDAAAPLLAGADATTTGRFVDLLAELSPRAADRLRQAVPAAPAQVPPTDAADLLDATVRRAQRLGLHAAVAAVRRGQEPPPVTVTPWADAGPPVTPMSDVDELVAVLSQVIEGRAAPIDIERALDAVARTGPNRPGDFNRRIGPLSRLARRHRFPAGFPAPSIAWMVSVWLHLGGAYAPGPREIAPDHWEPLPYQWLSGRIHEVAAGSRDPDSRRLLALPTHPRGWLDPAVLVQRAAAADPRITRPLDTAIALARLAPVDQPAALRQAATLAGPLGTAVRAALGGDDDIAGLPPPVARTITWLRGTDHPGPSYWFGQPEPHQPPRESYAALLRRAARQRRQVQPHGQGGYSPLQQQISAARMYGLHSHRGAPWAATLWPGDHRWLWWYEATSAPALPLLLDPNEPISSEALTAIVRHVDRDEADERTLAADVLAAAIGDGRLSAASLGTALHQAIEADVLPYRLAALLRAAAAPSVLHRAVIRAALLQTVPAWPYHLPPGEPRYQLVALLDELCEADSSGVCTPEAQAALITLATGRSKTAATARRLLTRPPGHNSWPPDALAAALAYRIARQPAQQQPIAGAPAPPESRRRP